MSFVTADEASKFCQFSQNVFGPVTLFKQMQMTDNERIPFASFRNEHSRKRKRIQLKWKKTLSIKTGNIRQPDKQKHVLMTH